MQKNKALILAWLVYLLIFCVIYYLRLQDILSLGLVVVGSLIGFILPIVLDILLPKMMDGSATADTTFAKDILKESANQIRQGNVQSVNVPKTPLRSYPLLLAYFAAAIFIITSTQSRFGQGLVLGLGFSLVGDLFLFRDPSLLRERWFSVFRTNLTDAELHYFVFAVIAIFVLISFFAVMV